MVKKFSDEFFKDIVNLEKSCFSDGWSENMLLSEIKKENSHIYIFEKDGVPVGYILCSVCLDEAEIFKICVEKSHRGCGIGKELIYALINNIDGISSINLEVRKSNISAVRLYEKCGFKTIGIRKKYYKDNEDAVLMTLRL